LTSPKNITSTAKSALQAGADALAGSSSSARLDAELLLGHALQRSRAWLYANPEAPLTADSQTVFLALLGQRSSGRPLAHLTGTREFWSLPLEVNEHTLVPRPETELLMERALQLIELHGAQRLLELGTGSGALAVALATEQPQLSIVATDASAAALEIAQRNAERHAPERIEFYAGDWYAAVAEQPPFDIIISNPPYIATGATALTDPELAFEPVQALYSGASGLNAIKTIITQAHTALRPGGLLALEHGFDQAAEVAKLLAAANFDAITMHADLAGLPRVTEGRLAAQDMPR
jgi:release factor glutamine methyltransferase